MDLIRKMLLLIEDMPEEPFTHLEIEGINEKATTYHLQLLSDAGLISINRNPGGYYPKDLYRLTWEGHEFIGLMKKDTNWNHAKEIMARTGGMAFEILLKVLVQYAAKQAGVG